jgi:hypothetical protein
MIEAVIDLNGAKLLGVEAKHLLVGKFFGIEGSLPLFVGVARRADAKLTLARNGRFSSFRI